jgi:hypothetical protein
MKKRIIFGTILISSILLSFTLSKKTNDLASKEELCFDFYIKCKGSNQFLETVKAKSLPEAKTKLSNRYPDCTIQSKSTNGHNCD